MMKQKGGHTEDKGKKVLNISLKQNQANKQ